MRVNLNLSLNDSRIDTRDVIDYVAWLDEEDDRDEIDQWNELLAEAADYSEESPEFGIFLVAERDWVEYAQEIADELGAIPNSVSWPMTCIDWNQAADDLAQDYSLISVAGHGFYVR